MIGVCVGSHTKQQNEERYTNKNSPHVQTKSIRCLEMKSTMPPASPNRLQHDSEPAHLLDKNNVSTYP